MKNRIKELESQINSARNSYYNGSSTISDQAYDKLIDELSELDPKNLAIINIGAEPISNWEKYTHLTEMGSLNKCQTTEEFKKWADNYIDEGDEYFITLKLDGLSVSLIYENGLFVKASTRGSGTIGELITNNVAKMIGVPLRLKNKLNITVRGEILLSKENHQKYFTTYSNTRNAASGISRRYDGNDSDKLHVLVYQLYSDDIELKTQEEQFSFLEQNGFTVPKRYVLSDFNKVIELRDNYQNTERDKYSFDLDGLVAHNNNLDKIASHGITNGRPKASIAIKFESLLKEGYIERIDIQLGNSGRITPVAVFNPKVNLMGADVEKASLHNFSNIRDLGIDIGCTVLVCRSNDVIPFVEEVVKSTGTIFKTPTNCPKCNTELISVGEYIQCPNVKTCPGQVTGRIENWISELNILEWGSSLIEKLVESGKVTTIADLYRLSIDDLANLDRMGVKSAKNCYDTLWKDTSIPLNVFIGGLSIPMIGSSTIKLIMLDGYDTLEKLEKLKASDFEKVLGVGPTKAKFLADGLVNNHELIHDILSTGVTIKMKIEGVLSGKSVAFTGKMENKRAVLEKMVQDAGGDIKSSVGKGLSLLIISDPENSTSSKAVAARKHGTKLISEDDFLELVK